MLLQSKNRRHGRYLSTPVLGGHPVLSGHYSIPRGCPLNTGFTVVVLLIDLLIFDVLVTVAVVDEALAILVPMVFFPERTLVAVGQEKRPGDAVVSCWRREQIFF